MATGAKDGTLDDIRVAAPCEASWDRMEGDDRIRFCGSCRLNVYNLSALPREAAERLVREREGRLCVRFFRRADGTMLTADCPVGVAALRRRMLRLAAVLAASLGLAAAAGTAAASASGGRAGSGIVRALRGLLPSWMLPAPAPVPIMGGPIPVMGKPAPAPIPAPIMGDVADPPAAIQGEVVAPPRPEIGRVAR